MRTATTTRFGGIAAIAMAAALSMSLAGGGRLPYPAPGAQFPAPAAVVTRDSAPVGGSIIGQLAAARLATAKYATSLATAKADGYQIITKMIPDMGYHFMNPHVQGFDIRKPAILVYEHQGSQWQLGALEWVFTTVPATPPLPHATFGFFPAACHYVDGTFIPDNNPKTCPKKARGTGATFNFWHPNLYTMHVWVWYPNLDGLYASMNPLVAPFNGG